MKMFKLTKPLDEQGVSVVLGAILLLGIGIAVGSLVYSEYVQSTLHSTEAGFMNDVGGKFVQLQSSISTMGVGQWSIVNLKMNPSFPFFIPTQGEVGTLSANPGEASSALSQLSAKIWNSVGGSSGTSIALNSDNDDEYWEANQVVFSERFLNTNLWYGPQVIPPDNQGTAGFDPITTYPNGDGTGSINVDTRNQAVPGVFTENAVWWLKRDLGVSLSNIPITLQAWLGHGESWSDINQPPTAANAIWRIDVENGYQATSPQNLYAHQEKTTIPSGDNYYSLKNVSAENTGTNLTVSTADNGRKLWGSFVYPLAGFNTIPASTWNIDYRSWVSVPPVYDNVSSENVYQGGTTGFTNAQVADNNYENIYETDYGAAAFDNYAYVSSYSVTTGSLDNFDNQKQENGGWSTLSMAYVSTDNNITNGAFTTNDNGWTSYNNGYASIAWTSSGYANGGAENISSTQKNKSGEGYVYENLPTMIPAGSTVILSYAWQKGYQVAVPTQQDIIVTLVKPSGATVDIDNQLGAPAAYNTWYTINKDISSYFTENGTYQIRMRYLVLTPNTTGAEGSAKFDEVRIIENNYRLDVFENVGSVIAGNSYKVQLNFRLNNNKENFRVQVQNASNGWDNFDNVITYSGGNWTTWENNINPSYIVGNTVRLRFVDNTGKYPLTTNLQLDYVRVKSTTDAAPVFLENVQQNITGIPSADNYQLQTGYYTAGNEAFSVYLYNFTTLSWDNVGVLTGGSSGSQNTFTYIIDSDHISSGNVYVRYVQPNSDTILSSLMVDYTRVKISYTVAAHASIDILIRKSDNNKQTLVADVENSANLTLAESTLPASYSFGGYAGFGQTDYLEIDYYCDVLSSAPGSTAYLKIDNTSLAPTDQTRVENVLFGYPSNSWNTLLSSMDSSIGVNGAKYWIENYSRPINGTVDNIRIYLYALINASGNHLATADTWVDDISLLAGPPFWDNVLIGSKQILSPQYVDNVVVTIGFTSADSGSIDNLYLLENNHADNWLINPVLNLADNLSKKVPADSKQYYSFTIDIENNRGKYIDNNGIIWLNFLAENDTSPFRLQFDYVNFQVSYEPGYEQNEFIQGYYGSSGALTFQMNLYSFPNQNYIYDDGAVILSQNSTSVMFSPPIPPLVDVSDINGDPNNIEVDVNHVALIGYPPPPITKTGYASVGAKLENEYPVFGPPNNLPENSTVVIKIENSPLTAKAWQDYLIDRANYFMSENFFYSKGFHADYATDENWLTLTIWNPDFAPHILYYEYVKEVSFSIS
jgi:hypothetical protein